MAISMLRSSTVVSITYTAVNTHAATGDLVSMRAQSKNLFPVRAPSRSSSSVLTGKPESTPPKSSTHPEISEESGTSSMNQLAAKATSKKSSSTRK